jgi:ribonuclease HI
MSSATDLLIKKAYATPPLRGNIVNKGLISLYCDYSGEPKQGTHGVACCYVHNRTIRVTAKKLDVNDHGSEYGELLAIIYSLEILAEALMELSSEPITSPKLAAVLTDCHFIERILTSTSIEKPLVESSRDQILTSLQHLHSLHPTIRITIRCIGKHKKNNALHRLAHNAARQAIGK